MVNCSRKIDLGSASIRDALNSFSRSRLEKIHDWQGRYQSVRIAAERRRGNTATDASTHGAAGTRAKRPLNSYEGLNLPQLMDLMHGLVMPAPVSLLPVTAGWWILSAWLLAVLIIVASLWRDAPSSKSLSARGAGGAHG